MLELRNINCGYDNIDVIKNISFKVKRGNMISIVGPNGCGKSTLLKAIAKLMKYKGDILLDSNNINKLSRKDISKKIALMTQTNDVYFSYTVYETISLGRYAYLKGPLSSLRKEDKDIINKAIETVELTDLKDKAINELSGGQLQRVFLARAFTQDPEVILLDEPTNHLDLKHQIDILNNLCDWAKNNNKIVICVLHDLNLANIFSNKVIMLKRGQIIGDGSPKSVFMEDKLKHVYDINIRKFMIEALEKWK
ncbi:ABC transporter ATP-binding protein [Clostridium oceanicum]|uniref:ABC transporter ATP-binding protein n=1 Tax=Clostridium oceanicum TaxID=1543 RepID=A0ABN1JQL8_9CLOT